MSLVVEPVPAFLMLTSLTLIGTSRIATCIRNRPFDHRDVNRLTSPRD